MTGVVHVAGINPNDMVNGEGTCVSIFLSGCPFHCPGCHNSEAWDSDYGDERYTSEVIDELTNDLTANGIQRNLSILGGEPLWEDNDNADNVAAMLVAIKQNCPNTRVFLWTGYIWEDLIKDEFILHAILPRVDVLIDGPYIQSERDITLWLRGSRNQRVIDVQESLKAKEVKLYQKA